MRDALKAGEISIHALRVEGDILFVLHLQHFFYFYPRPPGGGRHTAIQLESANANFYPRPPGGGRPASKDLTKTGCLFLSTPSGWRATTI